MNASLSSPVKATVVTRIQPRVSHWSEPSPVDRGSIAVWLVAIGFFLATTAASWCRWLNFQYRTFDLAYYVQAVWQLIHGRFTVTVEPVPLLGNHVEPVILLFVPLFALVRHPMLFVVVQNAALAAMAPLGYRLARRAGMASLSAVLLAGALLLNPAAGYIALHEFHPEALAAPLLLLLFYARATSRLWLHWVCLVAVLACKENMALVVSAYCIVFLVIDRGTARAQLVRWYGAPLVLALGWLLICTKVITPAFNSGNIDYLALYDRLGKSAGEICWNAITKPQLIIGALAQALTHGNLLWALLLPFLGLPVVRPRWLLVAAPVLFQHLLSWRSSEWQIYFHYAAPMLPVFWIASVEALVLICGHGDGHSMEGRAPASPGKNGFAGAPPSSFTAPRPTLTAAGLVTLACLTAQVWIGPAGAIGSELLNQPRVRAERQAKLDLLNKIPANASVVAPLPYLSHLAMREKLYSLHYVLKGLKTLSRANYQPPPPPDAVLVDYDDSATFDAAAGFYHPQMRTNDGRIIPSSDRLFHEFMVRASWTLQSRDALGLFQRAAPNEPSGVKVTGRAADADQNENDLFAIGGNKLRHIRVGEVGDDASPGRNYPLVVLVDWIVDQHRDIFPWLILRVTSTDQREVKTFTKGLCAVEVMAGPTEEQWLTELRTLPAGEYVAEAIFVDHAKQAWAETRGQRELNLLMPPIPLGKIKVTRPTP